MVSATCAAISTRTTISSLTWGRASTRHARPLYNTACRLWRPKAITSLTVRPCAPTVDSASLDLVELERLDDRLNFFHKYFATVVRCGLCKSTPAGLAP